MKYRKLVCEQLIYFHNSNNSISRNRISTSIAKAEISTGSNSSPSVSTSSDTNVNSEDQASAASKKNIKTNPVRNHLSFLDDIFKILWKYYEVLRYSISTV